MRNNRPSRPTGVRSGGGVAKQTIEAQPAPTEQPTVLPVQEDTCPVSPLSILEAMLFVGNRDNKPLSANKAAELMRDVAAEEIPMLVEELNQRYDADNCPYHIVGEGDGYRLTLRKTHSALRNKFYGRIREARLSQAAIDVLAIVAYQQPLTRRASKPFARQAQQSHFDPIGTPRPAENRTSRQPNAARLIITPPTGSCGLFNLQSLDDLPRSEDSPK